MNSPWQPAPKGKTKDVTTNRCRDEGMSKASRHPHKELSLK
jgi:hypothetical protein